MKFKHIIICLLACILLLASCTGNKTPKTEKDLLDPKNPVTLTLWHYYVGENLLAIEAAVTEFNQTVGMEYGVIVDPVAMGGIADLEKAVTDSAMGVINSAPMPDIFSSYADKALALAAMDVLFDLNEFFTEDEKSAYVQSFINDGMFADGKLLLLPIVKSTELMYINSTSWNEFAAEKDISADSLENWETLYETAREYYMWTDAKTSGAAWDGRAFMGFDSVANYIITAAKQLGVNIIDGNSSCANLDEAVMREIFDIYVNGMALGYFNLSGKFSSDSIKSGDLIAYVGSSSSAAYFPTWIEKDNKQSPIDFLALAYPYFENGEALAIQQGAGMCVAKSTPQKEAGAALFLKWFTQPEQNIAFAMTTGYLPVQTAAYQDQKFTDVLDSLRAGDKAQNNVADVYTIALHQITQADTYAATPFSGSYDLRSILQSTLNTATDSARNAAAPLKEAGMSEEEILTALNMDSRFNEWVTAIKSALDEKDIAWK